MPSHFESLCQQLTARYEPREAQNIATLLFEALSPEQQNLKLQQLADTGQIFLEQATDRLLNGEPIQYILEEAHFYGYVFAVNPSVLIPRPETEELVYRTLSMTKTYLDQEVKILDVGTGSGCIPISLKKEAAHLHLSALDLSAGAIATAKANAAQLEAAVQFFQLDFRDTSNWSQLDQYHLIVSNPPYIPWQEKDLVGANVLGQEPDLALFVADEDPLLFYRLIADFAQMHLKEAGAVLVETNQYNAEEVVALFQSKGFTNSFLFQDLMGNDRIVLAKK